jgi:hypothetical protein
MFATVDPNALATDFGGPLSVSLLGQIIPEGQYFSFAATDQFEYNWTASDLVPQISLSPNSVIVTGSLHWLERTVPRAARPDPASPLTGRNSLCLYFFNSVDAPCTSYKSLASLGSIDGRPNYVEFAAGSCSFQLYRLPDELVIVATSSELFPRGFETRIVEALQFVLAKTLRLRALVRSDSVTTTLELYSREQKSAGTSLQPPIALTASGASTFSWVMFEKYLAYVLRGGEDGLMHICSAQLHHAREASANSIEAYSVGLSVAVEGLAKLVSYDPAEEDEIEFSLVREIARRFGQSREWRQELMDRVIGVLSLLNIPRVKDRVKPLIATGRVEAKYVRSWDKLRHPSVHAAGLHPSSEAIQKQVELIYDASVLMYQIIFSLIDYQGEYTDYGSTNWPTKTYPLKLEGV